MENTRRAHTVEEGERLSVLSAGDGADITQYGVVIGPAVLVAQTDQPVADIGGIAADVERNFRHLEAVTEVDLHTAVLHVAHVAVRSGITDILRQRNGHQHTIGALVEIIHRQRKSVSEERSVDTYVELLGFFPFQTVIRIAARRSTRCQCIQPFGTEYVIRTTGHG